MTAWPTLLAWGLLGAPHALAGPQDAGLTDAVGSDEAPLPAAPPAPGGRLTRGPFTGRGWFELGVSVLHAPRLPQGRRLTSAGLGGALGWRPHRNLGVFTALSTWIGNVERTEGVDEIGEPVAISSAAPLTAWDVLGVRAFVPLRRRIEPTAELATGLVVERRPFAPRRAWGTLAAALGLGVWVAPTMSLRFGVGYRVVARLDEIRHFVGGSAGFAIHF